jgi:hypothetical protein
MLVEAMPEWKDKFLELYHNIEALIKQPGTTLNE